MVSCNEVGKTKTLKPESSQISGNSCFEVVVKDYKIVSNQVNVEFLRIHDGSLGNQIIAEFLDANGMVVSTSSVNNGSDQMRFLLANNVGESSTISFATGDATPALVRFSTPASDNAVAEVSNTRVVSTPDEASEWGYDAAEDIADRMDEAAEEIADRMEDAASQVEDLSALAGELIAASASIQSADDDDDEEETVEKKKGSSSSTDWDKVLDDYEKYVDKYVSLMKKAAAGDISAVAEYASMLEKAQELSEELEDAEDELTPAQMARCAKIAKKMTDAAANML